MLLEFKRYLKIMKTENFGLLRFEKFPTEFKRMLLYFLISLKIFSREKKLFVPKPIIHIFLIQNLAYINFHPFQTNHKKRKRDEEEESESDDSSFSF